ncbi:MAG: urea ABC transporter permease subunit UrtB, partial [Gammaproteobacteria bacterium]
MQIWMLLALWISPSLWADSQKPAASEAEQALHALLSARGSQVAAQLDTLVATGDPRVRTWLEAWADNRLARVRKTGQLVILTRTKGREWPVTDALTGEDAGQYTRRDLKRFRSNSRLRKHIDAALLGVRLKAEDPAERLDLTNNLVGKLNADNLPLIKAHLESESNREVRERLTLALNIYRASKGEPDAIEALSGALHPAARAVLTQQAAGKGASARAATQALAATEQKLKLSRTAETLYFG